MNKILNINLGGVPFTIDIDAYNHLDNYLGTIRNHFSDSEGCDEIMNDIEVRMAELFQESMKGSSIISNKELDEVIKIMGTPEDFGAASIDEDFDDYDHTEESQGYTERESTRHKRLFRDGDDKVIGGLCSGIAAYMGISDPLWVRLAFVVLLLSGLSPIIYLLMWAIVPEAKTASDKLSMRGENINISNIAKTVEEEINELSKRITEIGKDLTSKKKDNTVEPDKPKRNILLRAVGAIVALIGGFIGGVFAIIKGILRPILKLTNGILLLALGLFLIALILGISYSLPFTRYVGPDSFILSSVGGMSLYLVFGIPLFFLLTLCAKSLFGYKMKDGWYRSLGLMWLAAIIVGSLTTMRTISSFQMGNMMTNEYSAEMDADIIKLSTNNNNDGNFFFQMGEMQLSGEGLYINDIHLNVLPSDDDRIYIKEDIYARGSTKKQALSNAEKVKSDIIINEADATIQFPDNFVLPKGNKYRGQALEYTVYIPQGKKLELDSRTSRRIDSKNFRIENSYRYNKSKYLWEIGATGLTSEEFNKEHNYELEITIDNMDQLFVEGDFEIDLVKADAPAIKIVGNKSSVDKVEYSTIKGIVNLNNPLRYKKTLKAYIYVTDLSQISLDHVKSTRLENLNQNKLTIYSNGSGNIHGTLEVDHLAIHADGRQNIDLMGKGESLTVDVSYATKLNLDKYIVSEANVQGNLNQYSKMHVQKSLICNDHNLRYIDLIGSPSVSSGIEDAAASTN